MNRFEKSIILLVPVNLLVFLLELERGSPVEPHWTWILGTMFLHFLVLFLTIRALYQRPFPDPNQKLTWCLWIILTLPIGLIIYLVKYGWKPRPH